ncbi:MAG TPA: NAD(P)/FAD-dependent oxidoreductase, partial [Planctomycetota bacterium]|nr:NAD(P)/FAD-dependent oxidoreductase [Planctomycetota bacterium]
KPCGEFLSPDGLRILAQVGLEDAVMASGAYPLHGLSLISSRGTMASDYHPMLGHVPHRPYGIGVRREVFDRVLQDAAARVAELRRGTRIVALERQTDGWLATLREDAGERQVHARLLVGADGRQSLVRRRTGLDLPAGRQRFALVCRATGIPHGTHGEMHLGPLGQVGLAPLGGGEVNLNLLLSEPGRRLLQQRSPSVLMRAALRATPSLRPRTTHAQLGPLLTTGSLPQKSRSVVDDGLALVGDAAGFCDPFTGEGMCFALQGAEALGATIAELPRSGAWYVGDLRTYADAYRARFGAKRRLGEGLQVLLQRKALADRLVALAGSSRPLSRFLVAMTGDYL